MRFLSDMSVRFLSSPPGDAESAATRAAATMGDAPPPPPMNDNDAPPPPPSESAGGEMDAEAYAQYWQQLYQVRCGVKVCRSRVPDL